MNAKVKLLTLCAVCLLFLSGDGEAAAQGRWQSLFDGKSTDAWRGFRRDTFPAKCWAVEGGALKTVVGCEQSSRVDLITKNRYRNFELELEWKVAPGGNSGVIYLLTEEEDQTWKTGPEMQVLDDEKHPDGKNPLTSAGSAFGLIAPTGKLLRPVGEFNKARLVVRDGRVEHWLNGKKVVSYELGGEALGQLIAQAKFKDMPRFARASEGHLALQYHGEEVWYRKIRVRELPGKR